MAQVSRKQFNTGGYSQVRKFGKKKKQSIKETGAGNKRFSETFFQNSLLQFFYISDFYSSASHCYFSLMEISNFSFNELTQNCIYQKDLQIFLACSRKAVCFYSILSLNRTICHSLKH